MVNIRVQSSSNTMNFTASKEIGNSRILGIFFGNASGLESTIEDILIAMRYSIGLEGTQLELKLVQVFEF